MKYYLAIPVEIIPQWTKDNIPTYPLGRFSNDGEYMLIDDAHPLTTYQKWLGPNFSELESIISQSVRLSEPEILELINDPTSLWCANGV